MWLFVASFVAVVVTVHSAESIPAFQVTDDELYDTVEQMRLADDNKASSNQVTVNFGGRIGFNDQTDNAPANLFTKVDPSILTKPTYAAFIKLFDNYNRDAGIKDPKVSDNEDKSETTAFLNAVSATRPYKLLLSFLKSKNHPYGKDDATLRAAITKLWFDRYSRAKGVIDSSGFEHVFIGEAKNGEVSGLHNWVRMYLLEKNDDIDYKGYTVKRENNMATIKLSWGDVWKPAGSVLIGTSPEYDLSVFTLCFLARRGSNTCKVDLDGCPFEVQSYDQTQNGKIYVGTAYPKAAGPCA